jgi:membrane-bound ClpP family serine protease
MIDFMINALEFEFLGIPNYIPTILCIIGSIWLFMEEVRFQSRHVNGKITLGDIILLLFHIAVSFIPALNFMLVIIAACVALHDITVFDFSKRNRL